jgi:RimJ/RimL family protein N-acetyltransferase
MSTTPTPAIETPPIETERLRLAPLTPQILDASLNNDHTAVEQLLGASVPSDWWAERWVMEIRREDLRRNVALQPWTIRAIVLREAQRIIGHIGFHTRPNPDYLQKLAPGGIEFGYTVFPDFRRRGYASEASDALMNWAYRSHGITRFIVSISPTNVASLALAQKFDFIRIGEQFDDEDEDGLEYIFERRIQGVANPEHGA